MGDDNHDIYLTLTGDDVSPETVRWHTLDSVVGGFDSALETMAAQMDREFKEREALIIPKVFERSSVRVAADVNRRAEDPLHQIDRAFQSGDISDLPGPVRDDLGSVQATVESRDAAVKMTGDEVDLNGISIAGNSPVIPPDEEEVSERTSHGVVYGICMRVNRTRNDATVVLHDGTKCSLEPLDDGQVQMLMKRTGENLEQVFRVEGEASWNPDDYKITKIAPVTIEPVERDAGTFFDELRDVTDGAFDDTDPIEYVEKMRGE